MPQKPKPHETDIKLFEWLEKNAVWLMKMDSTRIMACVGLNLRYGDTINRSLDDSLAAAKAELRKDYEGRGDEDARGTTGSESGTEPTIGTTSTNGGTRKP